MTLVGAQHPGGGSVEMLRKLHLTITCVCCYSRRFVRSGGQEEGAVHAHSLHLVDGLVQVDGE